MSNLKLWDSVSKTDPKYTKPIPGGAKLTAIGAQYQRKSATTVFGPMGIGWGTRNASYQFNPEHTKVYFMGQLWFNWEGKEGIIEIASDCIIKDRNDCMKSVRTDAITKGLSELGFNADVFMNDFSENKYLQKKESKKLGALRVEDGAAKGVKSKVASSSDSEISDPMPWGKHKGKSLKSIPDSYFTYCEAVDFCRAVLLRRAAEPATNNDKGGF